MIYTNINSSGRVYSNNSLNCSRCYPKHFLSMSDNFCQYRCHFTYFIFDMLSMILRHEISCSKNVYIRLSQIVAYSGTGNSLRPIGAYIVHETKPSLFPIMKPLSQLMLDC